MFRLYKGRSEYIILDENGAEIAAVYRSGDNSKANARLIEASPLLLEALKELADAIESTGGHYHPRVGKPYNKARALITETNQE